MRSAIRADRFTQVAVITAVLVFASCSPASEHKASRGMRFRKVTTNDYCSGMRVYSKARRTYFVGVLGDRYHRYRDPFTGEVLDAFHMRGLVNSREASVWRKASVVATWYVEARPAPVNGCVWIESDDDVTSTVREVAASELLIWVDSGEWETKRGFPS